MNYFSTRFVQDIHLSRRKKINTLILQVFGHEALYETNDLEKQPGHCEVFDIYIPRPKWPQLKQLALRKLLNPFKWLEFLFTVVFEMPKWALKRVIRRLNIKMQDLAEEINSLIEEVAGYEEQFEKIKKYSSDNGYHLSGLVDDIKFNKPEHKQLFFEKLNSLIEENDTPEQKNEKVLETMDYFLTQKEKMRDLISQKILILDIRAHLHRAVYVPLVLVNIIASIIFDLPLAILRRILAPSRYIIRPFLQYARSDTGKWIALVATSLLITLFIVVSVFFPGIFFITVPWTFKFAIVPLAPLAPLATIIASVCSSFVAFLGVTSGIAVMSMQLLFVTLSGITVLSTLQKLVTDITDFYYAAKKAEIRPEKQNKKRDIPNCLKPNLTTTVVTKILHGISPRLTEIKTIEKQTTLDTLFLITGTESIFSKNKDRSCAIVSHGEFCEEEDSGYVEEKQSTSLPLTL